MVTTPPGFQIVQERIVSKNNRPQDSEDRIFKSEDYVAVLDGVSSKSDIVWDEGTPGQVATGLIVEAFKKLENGATVSHVIEMANTLFIEFYKRKGVYSLVQREPYLRLMANFIAYSAYRREIWLVGDCQGFIGQKKIENRKRIDSILALVRSVYLEAELLSGKTMEELREKDTGREYILPLLRKQSMFQNNPNSSYGYPVVDGFPIPQSMVIVEKVPEDTVFVVLASDGYPDLEPDAEISEQRLREIIERDPLMFRIYPSTKGVPSAGDSYDDRAFIKILLPHRIM